MATKKTQFATDQDDRSIKLNANPSFRGAQKPILNADYDYALDGTEANADVIILGSLGLDSAEIIPELSRIVDTGDTGDVDFSATLQSVDADGNVTDLAQVASLDNNVVTLTRLASGATPNVDAADKLQLTLSSVEAVTAAETIRVELAVKSTDFAG